MAYWVDDNIDMWPESLRAGTAAMGLYFLCGSWISRGIGGGAIADAVVPVEVATMYGTKEWITRLCTVGLWEHVEDGYRDCRYFQMGNPTAEVVASRKAAHARRQALVRDPALRDAVRRRDRDRCRYCYVEVRWSDRRGPHGGTYDHVDPRGPNSFENLVVACRSCNSSKKDRTPEQAGMELRPPYLGKTQVVSRFDSGQNLDSALPPSLPPSLTGGEGRGPAQSSGAAPPSAAELAQHADAVAAANVAAIDTARRGAAAVRAALGRKDPA